MAVARRLHPFRQTFCRLPQCYCFIDVYKKFLVRRPKWRKLSKNDGFVMTITVTMLVVCEPRLPYEGFVTSYRVTHLTCVDIARVRLSFVAQLMLGCKSYWKGEIFWLLTTVWLNKYVYRNKLAKDKTHYQTKSQVYAQQRSIHERCHACCCKKRK